MDATPMSGLREADAEDEARLNILGQLWVRRGVFTLTFIVTFMLVVGLLYVLPVSYVSSGSVIVTDREPLGATTSAAAVQKIGDPADMESNILLIRSPSLLRAMLGQAGIAEAIEADCRATARQVLARLRPIDCTRVTGTPDGQLGWIEERFGVGALGRSRVISVGYKSAVPEAGPVLVNALIRTFLESERGKIMHSRDEAIGFIEERLQQVGGEMRRDEEAIEEYRSQRGLVRGVAGPLSSERLSQAGQQLSEAKGAEAEATLRLEEAAGGGSSRQALESRAVADLKQHLAQARAQVAGLSQQLGPNNPVLLAARQTEANLTRQLAAETGRILDSARRNLAAAHARVVEAQLELNRRTEAASEAAAAEIQIASMVRELETKRTTYVELSQRRNQLETERRMLEPSVQLVNLAEMPMRPAFPQRTPFLVGGVTLATVLATAAGLLTYRPKLPAGQIALGRTYTRVPILAQVPELQLRRAGRKELINSRREFPLAAALSLIDTHPPLLEALRILHARLTLAGFGTRRRTLLVTSEAAGEGKTFVTLALARLARAAGRRVLVIETTLREPFLEVALNCPPSPGLSGYLEGAEIDTVKLGAVPGVDFLLAGDALPTSTELLSGRRFLDLLDWAQSYDLVLIDSAPVSALMDTALIAPHVEGVLFCLRAGRGPVVHGLSSLPELQRDNGNVVGLVMTFAEDNGLLSARVPSSASLRLRQPASVGHG